MNVLGLNGWDTGLFHDASACLVSDGRVVSFVEEERFTRSKHAYGAFPHAAAAFCLGAGGLTVDDLDAVAFGWDLRAMYGAHGLDWHLGKNEMLDLLLPRERFPRTRRPPLHVVPHHVAHAASAFHPSGASSGAVLVIDGQGETASATLARADERGIEVLDDVPAAWSLGFFYEAACEYVGLAQDEPGKLMGLAAHGSPISEFDAIVVSDDGYEMPGIDPRALTSDGAELHTPVIAAWLRVLERTLPVARNRRVGSGAARAAARDPYELRDVAATVQDVLERAVIALARRVLASTGARTLMLAGGVALNASLNGKLLTLPEVDRLFVQPVAHDAGASLGAALHVAAGLGDCIAPMQDVAWGPEYDPGTIARELDALGVPHEYLGEDLVADEAARAVAAHEIIAWFQGPAEAGPRALGHRSIITSPASADLRDHVNANVKRREWWRPLAPSIAAEDAETYLDPAAELPYMIVATSVRPEVRSRVEGIVHVDGSARPQTVRRETNPLYHRLLKAVERETGVPVVLNTSFNRKDEPIVLTPREAVEAAWSMRLPRLFAGPFLVRTGQGASAAGTSGQRVSVRRRRPETR